MSYFRILCVSSLAFSGLSNSAQAALFAGSSGDPLFAMGALRWGINGGGQLQTGFYITVNSTLEILPGTITTDFSMVCPGVTVAETYSVTDPSTSETKNYYITVLFDPFEVQYNVGPMALSPNGSVMSYNMPGLAGIQTTLTGSYQISGDSTASGTFSTTLIRPSTGFFAGSISSQGDPQQITWVPNISNTFNATSNPLFSVPVGAETINFNLSAVNWGMVFPMTMQAVPESGVCISILSAGMMALVRRKRA